jgi:hypothetical protein
MIPVPNLDTIAFDALVEQGRGLIPRYAPDWTDHNLHDPGTTLLDLLAWVIDQQVYRIGFVGDAHLRAFAALLQVKPSPAKPARGLLWPDRPSADQALAAGTRAWPLHQPELIFTTAAGVRLSGASIDAMTARSEDRIATIRPDAGGAIRLDPATQSLELRLDRPLFDDADAVASAGLGLEFAGPIPDLEAGGAPPIAVDYRTRDGLWHRAGSRWIDGGARRSGVALLKIEAGHDGVTAFRLGFDGFPVRALPRRVALNVLPLVQVETAIGLELGDSRGLPDLELPLGAGALPAAETVLHPLRVRTLERGVPVEWTRVDDLAAQGPSDSVYQLDEASGTIRFGNGVNGRIPPAGQIDRDALDRTVGAQGNLIAGVTWCVGGPDPGAASWKNRDPVTGGCDPWDRETLLAALRRRSRERSAMLSDAQLREAAADLEGYGLDRVEVLSRFLPTLPHRAVPGARTLLLHPAEGVEGGDSWVDAIERRLAARRVLGERLSLVVAEPVTIAVSAELLVAGGSDAPAIRKAAIAVLQARLSASRKSPSIEPWPSGRPVTIGELEALVAGVEGVIAVPRLRVGGRGDPPEQVSVPLARIEVAVAGEIDIALQVEA